jgi:hypothetical protein
MKGSTAFALDSIPVWGWLAIGAVLVLYVVLVVICLVDLSRRTDDQVVGGRRWVWVLVVLLINSGIGALLYLLIGRKPAPVDEGTIAAPSADATSSAVDALYGTPKGVEPR